MLEAIHAARRSAALPASPSSAGAVAIRALGGATRISLRVKGVEVPVAASPRAHGERSSPRSRGPGEGQGNAPLETWGVPGPSPGRSDERLDLSPLAGRGFAGQHLALMINRCAVSGERLVARLGPDEWLVIGPEDEAEALAAEIDAALAGRFHALVDISHRNVALEVSGPQAADILNAGCPLDLHASAFPPGSATRTLLGKAEIVLMRLGSEPIFRVECWRSFATYVHGFLMEAARDV